MKTLALALILAFQTTATTGQLPTPGSLPQATAEVPVSATAAVRADTDQVRIRRGIVGAGETTTIGGMIVLPDDAQPFLANFAHLTIAGDFDTATLTVDDMQRELVPADKIDAKGTEWIIKGKGRVIATATIAARTELGITLTTRRYDITIPPLGPGPVNPEPVDPVDPIDPVDPVDPEPAPNVPPDAFDNIGQRVAALVKDIPAAERQRVAAIYREYAGKLEISAEAAKLSQEMVDARTAAIASSAAAWQPALSVIATDFNTRRPNMLRVDVVEHWKAVANGLDPQ